MDAILLRAKQIDDNGITELRTYGVALPRASWHFRDTWIKRAVGLFEEYKKGCGEPDVIHAHSSIWAGVAAAQIQSRYGVPYVITEHRGRFVANEFVGQQELSEARDPLVRAALNDATAVITVSKRMQTYLLQIAPAIADRLTAIPNMVDTELFRPTEHNYAGRPFTFVSVGFLTPVKGFDSLIRAFIQVDGRLPDKARLRIVGGGPELASLQEIVRTAMIQDKVEFLGAMTPTEVAQELRQADAFVLASRYEAFGVVFIEALSTGLPIIGTYSGGPEEIIGPENGLIVRPDDIDGLANAMAYLVANPAAFDRSRIREQAIANYSQPIVAERVLEVLRGVT